MDYGALVSMAAVTVSTLGPLVAAMAASLNPRRRQ